MVGNPVYQSSMMLGNDAATQRPVPPAIPWTFATSMPFTFDWWNYVNVQSNMVAPGTTKTTSAPLPTVTPSLSRL